MILDAYGDILAENWKAGDDMVIANLEAKHRDMSTGHQWIKTHRPELHEALTGNEEDVKKVRFAKKP
ncbi:MAG: hypothetical protein OSA93_18320 [Akkermansiaceae bacterium]|nr:hypothetical protein [Akkermansiaceae bacterium]